MNKDKLNRAGFTLIETLIVLIIVGFCLALLTLRSNQRLFDSVESRIFFNQLASELEYAQELALISGWNVIVKFDSHFNHVNFVWGNQQVIYETLVFPENWLVNKTLTFYYLPNGRVSRFESVRFTNYGLNKTVNVAFQLGSGKFEIQY